MKNFKDDANIKLECSGRTIIANLCIFGMSANPKDGFDIYEGHEGRITFADHPLTGRYSVLTRKEKREISQHMMMRWKAFRDSL